MKIHITLSVLFGLLFFAACSGDKNVAGLKNTDLVGTWECTAGSLDGDTDVPFAKTEISQGAMIEFSESTMKFELLAAELGKSKEQPYKLEAAQIVCTKDKELTFAIKNKEAKKMTLTFTIAGHNFEMTLERK